MGKWVGDVRRSCVRKTARDSDLLLNLLTTMRKRNVKNINDVIDSVNLPDGWFEVLSQDYNLEILLAELANQGNVTNAAFKRARTVLPSFSDAKWSELAPQFGLRADISLMRLPTFVTPVYLLPPTFHVANFTPAWRALDVYREISQQNRGEARVRILDPVRLLRRISHSK